MKYFLAASLFWTVSASAQSVCSTIWVYKPWKTCSAAINGPDKSAKPVDAGVVDLTSDWMGGGADQHSVCKKLEAGFNSQNGSNGKVGTLTQATPVSEGKRKNAGVYVEYRYTCKVSIAQYPFVSKASRACGEEEKLTYKVGGTSQGLSGDAYCLSCDEYKDPKDKVSCLKMMIVDVINPKAEGVDFRPDDIKAVSASVERLFSMMARKIAVPGLSDNTETYGIFDEFLTKNPAR